MNRRLQTSAVPRIYLQIKQLNAMTQHALRELHQRLPDDLAVYSQQEGDVQRIWVAYPEPYGEEKARAAIRDTLTEMSVTDITLAD
jgi:hypothetical protein